MKTIGQILLWLGFLSGSLATVFYSSKGAHYVANLKPEDVPNITLPSIDPNTIPEEGWAVVPWTWYIISVVVCIVGIVLLRVAKASEGQKTEESAASLKEIQDALTRVIKNVNKLSKEVKNLAPSKITKAIDDQLADDLRIFADGRESITSEFGLNVFADVMTQFAAGERSINRAWSAAADGYVDEAATCIDRALAMMEEAEKILTEQASRASQTA